MCVIVLLEYLRKMVNKQQMRDDDLEFETILNAMASIYT